MVDQKMRERFHFFLEHAGYSTPPGKAVCALSLARAEEWADQNGIRFEWRSEEYDYEYMLGDHEYWCNDAKREAAGYAQDGTPINGRDFIWRNGYCAERTDHDHEILICYACDPHDDWSTEYPIKVLASLGGIIDPDRDYRRVIEAELASEVMTANQTEERKTA